MQFIHALHDWWHQQSWLEVIGFVTGLICVLLAAINNIWNWPVAVVNTCLYVYIFATATLYADMCQYVCLTIINLYGWYYWSRKKNDEVRTPVKRISSKQVLRALAAVVIITPVLGYTLVTFTALLHYHPPAYPYLDSFCTVCSLTAQVYLSRRVLENWLIWIFVDVIYVGVYLSKGLQITAILFAVYLVLAVFGYIDWRKIYKKQLAS